MNLRSILAAFAVLLIGVGGFAVVPCSAQGMTSQQADDMLTELRQIRRLLERLVQQQAAPAAVPQRTLVRLKPVKGFVLGRPDAPVTLVEYGDLECPFCRRFHQTTFAQLKTEYIDTGKLRYVARDLPLTSIHPEAFHAASATRCAGEQGKFWEMRTALLMVPRLQADTVDATAGKIGLDVARLQACVNADKYRADIERDSEEAIAFNITGTPSFLLAKTSEEEVDAITLVGAIPFQALKPRIDELLRK